MGWDAEITVRFATPEDPVRRFASVVHALRTKPFRLIVRQERDMAPIANVDLSRYILAKFENEAAATAVEDLGNQYAGPRLAVEGWWSVPRFEPQKGDGEPQLTEYSVITTVLGDEYEFPVLRYEPAHLVYNIRDSKWFSPDRRGEAARKNIELAVNELDTFIALGADRIRGLDMDKQAKPEECWLLYHRRAEGYSDDLAKVTGAPPVPLTPDSIRSAAAFTAGVSIKEVEGGFLMWRGSVDENLSEFFATLSKLRPASTP